MPTYEYRCAKGHSFERFQRMSDLPPEDCEVCGTSPVERVLHPVAVHFKGSGFYSTDYGRRKKKEPSKDGEVTASGERKAEEKAVKSSAEA